MSEQEIKRQNKAEAVAELFSINIQFPPSLLCVCVCVFYDNYCKHYPFLMDPWPLCCHSIFAKWSEWAQERQTEAQGKYLSQMLCFIIDLSLFSSFSVFFFFFLNIARCVNPLCSSYLGEKNKQKKGILSCLLIVTLLLICFCLSFFLECLFSAQSPRLLLPWRRLLVHAVCILPDSLS